MLGYFLFFLAIGRCLMLEDQEKALKWIFIVISLFSGLRYGIGYDYYTYLWCCSPYSNGAERFEYIPRCMAEISQQTFPYLFFILSTLFISFFYYRGIKNGGRNYSLEVLFYIGFPFLFFNQLGIIRQGMASSIIFFAIVLRYSRYEGYYLISIRLLLLIVAFLCHKSAIVSVFILFPWERVSQKVLWLMFLSCMLAGNLITPFLESIMSSDFWVDSDIIEEADSEKAIKYLYKEGHGEGKMIKWLIYIIGVVSLSLYDKLIKRDEKNAYYIGVLVLGISLYALFSYNSTLSKRFCMFFFSTAIFIVPQIAQLFKFSKGFYVSMCALLFVLQVYIGSSNIRPQDSNGSSVSYPYRTYINKYIK